MVGQGCRLADRLVAARGHRDLDSLLGEVPDPSGVDLEVLPLVVDEVSGEGMEAAFEASCAATMRPP